MGSCCALQAPKAKAASPFGNLFSWGQEAVTVDADEKVNDRIIIKGQPYLLAKGGVRVE